MSYQAGVLLDFPEAVKDQERGRLLVLEAEKDEADNIIQLICAANLIIEGFPDSYDPPTFGFPIPEIAADREGIFQDVFRSDGYFQKFIFRETLPVAVAFAAKAWRDKKLVYAIHKLAMSYQTESVTPWSMHPRHGQAFLKHTSSFASHVGTAVAINLAYSAIEEIGLTVQASIENPRSIGGKEFVWNPNVLKPFKDRLRGAGIDPEGTIEWVTRGDQTEVDIYKMLSSPTEYANGADVRDRQVTLPDAINFCEYLRNTMTTHAFSESTPRLGPYEVYNTQHVARFLLLTRCGLWNTWVADLRERYR